MESSHNVHVIFGFLTELRAWWDTLCDIGPQYGYFVNSSKTFLIVKEEHLIQARSIFVGTNIQFTTEGKRYLGSAFGSPVFVQSYVDDKVKEWTDKLSKLCDFASLQPHAAFSALIHGAFGRLTYLSRTLPELLSPFEQNIHLHFLPTLTGKGVFSDLQRQLLPLPSRLGGLGIINPCVSSAVQFESSQKVTSLLVTLLIEQVAEFTVIGLDRQHGFKQEIHLRNRHNCEELASALHPQLFPDLWHAREFACCWLTVFTYW